MALEQIDYEKILEDRNVDHALEQRDDIWRSLVNSIVEGRPCLRFAAAAAAARDCRQRIRYRRARAPPSRAPKCSADGSPLDYDAGRHGAGDIPSSRGHCHRDGSPDRLPDVMRNVAAATTTLDPHVVMQIMQTDEGLQETPILGKIAHSFDDDKVADLLATALSRDGKATARLARSLRHHRARRRTEAARVLR